MYIALVRNVPQYWIKVLLDITLGRIVLHCLFFQSSESAVMVLAFLRRFVSLAVLLLPQ